MDMWVFKLSQSNRDRRLQFARTALCRFRLGARRAVRGKLHPRLLGSTTSSLATRSSSSRSERGTPLER
eukprot:2092063-Amphidinium_carterae.1